VANRLLALFRLSQSRPLANDTLPLILHLDTIPNVAVRQERGLISPRSWEELGEICLDRRTYLEWKHKGDKSMYEKRGAPKVLRSR
jgi:hypothetical protein